MPNAIRRPPVAMESREPRSIRFEPSTWLVIAALAKDRGMEPSAFARECCCMGLMLLRDPELLEAYTRVVSRLQVAHAGSTHGGETKS